MENFRKAILARATDQGLAYIVDAQTNEAYAFTFDKIENYRGESCKEMGLRTGVQVLFRLDANAQVEQVLKPVPPASIQKSFKNWLFKKNNVLAKQ